MNMYASQTPTTGEGNSLLRLLDPENKKELPTGSLGLNSSLVAAALLYCEEHEVELRFFLATAWTGILTQFTGSSDAHFGFVEEREVDRQARHDHGLGFKGCMQRTSYSGGNVNVQELFQATAWQSTPSTPELYETFNTGIAISWHVDESHAELNHERGGDVEFCEIMLIARPQQQTVTLSYVSRALSDGHARNIVCSLEQAISNTMHDPSVPIYSLDLVSKGQREQILRWNDFQLAIPKPSIVDLLSDRISERSACTAIDAWDGTLTYADLDNLSSIVAAKLRSLGIGPNLLVPVSFEKSKWVVVAMVGVLKTGAGFIPVEPATPMERVRTMLDQASPVVGVASIGATPLLQQFVQTVLVVSAESMAQMDCKTSTKIDHCTLTGSEPAYCLFTSGSTGPPKGCIISHRALANLEYVAKAMHLDTDSRVLQFGSFAYVLSLIDTFATLVAGGVVCIPSAHERSNDLAGAMNRMQVNWTHLTATVLRPLQPTDIPSLRTLHLGGETIDGGQIKTWAKSVRMAQVYGMTETTCVVSASTRIQHVWQRTDIGRPINAKFWLVNQHDASRLAPIGAVAELMIEGPGLAEGYLNLPQRTADAFPISPDWIDNMAQCHETRRFYRTGDLVRYQLDGSTHYIGRKDQQVKIRGHRLQPSEVESHLLRHFPRIKSVIVEAVCPLDRPGQPVLCACIQTNDLQGQDTSSSPQWVAVASPSFRAALAQVLPISQKKLADYMVPQLFIPIRHRPVTWTGKSDRRAVTSALGTLTQRELFMRFGNPEPEQSFREISTENEKLLQSLWAQVLGIPQTDIGAESNFFHLGGNSVAAMKLVTLARSNGVSLTVSHIFQYPRLCDLHPMELAVADWKTRGYLPFSLLRTNRSQLVSSLQQEGFPASLDDVEDILPATYHQRYYFNLLTMLCIPFRIRRKLDAGRLREACAAVVDKYAVLRTMFAADKTHGVVQIILKHIATPFCHINIDHDIELDIAASRLKEKAVAHPQVLPSSIPLQFTLLSQGPQEHVFMIRISHSQLDVLTSRRIALDLSLSYNECVPRLPPSLGFADYVYLREQRPDRTAAFDFWSNYLRGSRITSIPCMATAAKIEDVSVAMRIPVPTPPDGMTVATVVHAAVALLVSQTAHAPDITFGVLMDTRVTLPPGFEDMTGLCTNINPFRVRLDQPRTGLQICQLLQTQYQQISQFAWLEWPDLVSRCTDWPSDACLRYVVFHADMAMADLPLQFNGADCSPLPPRVDWRLRDRIVIRCFEEPGTLEVQVRTTNVHLSASEAKLFGQKLIRLMDLICRKSGEFIVSDHDE